MPVKIKKTNDIKPGDLYEDSLHHPCLCISKEGTELSGISLVDGSYPRSDDLQHKPVRKLTLEEAWQWRIKGPQDVQLPLQQRWWEPKSPHLVNPAAALENLYFFSLYQVEWNEDAIAHLGTPIKHEWHNVRASIEEKGSSGIANVVFDVQGASKSAAVYVKAHKAGQDWLFDDLYLELDSKQDRIIIIESGRKRH